MKNACLCPGGALRRAVRHLHPVHHVAGVQHPPRDTGRRLPQPAARLAFCCPPTLLALR